MVKNYATYSFWLETCGDDLTPRAPLDGSISVDVAIMGAGFTGLWTAYHLLERDPSLKVVVVEKEIAGFGASGRNGGWCFSGFPYEPSKLTARYGRDAARAVSLAMYDSVDDVGRVCEIEGIDAHYAKGGELEIARASYEMAQLEEMYEEYRAIGLEDHYQLLDANQTEERIRVAGAIGSFWNKEGAAVQPARLVRGLARAVERHGGVIYEQTAVLDYVPGPLPRLDTARGNISAKAIVLAGEGYLSTLPKLRRRIVPATSHIVITEPLSDDLWQEIGWEHRDVVGGFGTTGAYLNHTADGRIAFGPYRGKVPFNSRITDELDRPEEVFAHARRSALEWFPMLRDAGVRFTHSWGGVFGVPRDHMPIMRYDRRTGVAMGYGYSGEGVATANLSGRVLADLITERETDLTQLPTTRHQPIDWEPEPIRWTGYKIVRRARYQADEEAERTGRRRKQPRLGQRLWNFEPPHAWRSLMRMDKGNDA
jgi:glycine/D-amino acid oxidase-like deaminating enzyme